MAGCPSETEAPGQAVVESCESQLPTVTSKGQGRSGVLGVQSELQLERALDKSTAGPHSSPTRTSFADVLLGHIQRGARVGEKPRSADQRGWPPGPHIRAEKGFRVLCLCRGETNQ